MPTITDYHGLIRDAIATTLRGLGIGVAVSVVDEPDDMFALEMPCIGLACVGPEQDREDWGTNIQDGRGYPVAIALLQGGTTRGEKDPGVITATQFRRLITTTFSNKRLTGVSQVGFCEVSDSGPIWDEKNPRYQKILTAMVVTGVGKFPRS